MTPPHTTPKGANLMQRGDPLMDRYRGHNLPVMLYRHPFQIALGVALATVGLRTIAFTATRPASIETLPDWLATGYAISLIIGGLGMTLGLVIAVRSTWGLAIEQFGLWLTAFGLTAYAVGLLATVPPARSSLVVVILLALATACIIRSRAALHDSRYSLRGIRQEANRRNGGG